MKRFILIILAVFLFLEITACQPTPEEEIVLPKKFNAEEVVESQESTEIEPYKAPVRWDEKIETGINNFSIEVNAEIQIPISGRMPLAKIAYMDIPNEMAMEIKNALLDGEKIYIGDGVKTRGELEEEILLEEAKFTDPNSIINAQETEEMKALKRAGVEATIEMLKEQLKTAPESSNRREVTEFENIDNGVWGFGGGTINIEGKNTGITIIKYDDNLLNRVNYYNFERGVNLILRGNQARGNILIDDQKNYENLLGIKISMEEAKTIADEKVLEVAGEEFEICDIGSARKKGLWDEFHNFTQCYLFRYTRKINDAQVTYDNTVQTSGEYAEPRGYESISVAVDDSGIIAFEWNSPSEIKEILSDSVDLIRFNEIQEIFRKQILIEGVFEEEYNIAKRNIVVEEVKLGLISIAQEGNFEDFVLVPVWDFYGYTELFFNSQDDTQLILDENNTFTYRNYQYSYLTINAIDGSIIDRSLGY